MRKYVVGFLVGLLVASAFPVYGAVSSLVGKQVQAENAVFVNGNKLQVNAVNIGGTTYSPNRAIADALGMDIKFENNNVIFKGDLSMNDPAVTGISVEGLNFDLNGLQIQLRMLNGSLDNAQNEEAKEVYRKKIIEIEAQIKLLEEMKAELEAQSTPTP